MQLAILDENGAVIKLYGAITVTEFEAFARRAVENEARLQILVNKPETPKTVQFTPTLEGLRPYFNAYMIEYENRTTAIKRINEYMDDKRSQIASWAKKTALLTIWKKITKN